MLFTAEQEAFRAEVRSFVDRMILPQIPELVRNGAFPHDLFRKLGEAGYLDVEFSFSNTGARYGSIEGTIIMEEVARGLASLALVLAPHYQCTELIASAGNEVLKNLIIPDARNGNLLLAFAISEESGGSDAMGVDTFAVRKDDHWIISGKKCWITNAGFADGYVITARSPSAGRSRNASMFYIPKATPGLSVQPNANMLGLNNSPMGDVVLDFCEVPSYCLIGEENSAYRLIKPLLNEGRLDMAAVAVGLSQAALDAAILRSNRSSQYGRRLSSFQSISFSLADMYTKLLVSRNTLYSVASLMSAGMPHTMDAAALKLFATETAREICKATCQIYGASGLCADSDVNRYLRDAEMLTIAEGTSEICRIVVSTGILNSR